MSRRAYDTERETLLLAYDRVTPPRSEVERRTRESLMALARAIVEMPLRMRQTEIPGT